MKTKDYAEKRKALMDQLNAIQWDIIDSPSIDKWLKDAHPVDRQSFVSRLQKVICGALELLWIADNNYIWEPEPGCDIHSAKGELVRRIADFDVLKPSLGVFDDAFVKCSLIEKAANVSASINMDDANGRVWMRFNELAGPTEAPEKQSREDTATETSRPYLSPNYPELHICFNLDKVDVHHWDSFVDFIKKHREGKPIDMARIAYILRIKGVLSKPKIGWAPWYNKFCELCGIEVNKTYLKDITKADFDGMQYKRLLDELRQTEFIRESGGDALDKRHVSYNDGHLYQ